jgi:hypothetical protein
MWRII